MNANTQFEIKAAVFYAMTGFLAPGKDQGMVTYPTHEERQAAWRVWCDAYNPVLSATINAVDSIILNEYEE